MQNSIDEKDEAIKRLGNDIDRYKKEGDRQADIIDQLKTSARDKDEKIVALEEKIREMQSSSSGQNSTLLLDDHLSIQCKTSATAPQPFAQRQTPERDSTPTTINESNAPNAMSPMELPAMATPPEDLFSRTIPTKTRILTGIPNGEQGMVGLCWLIATIQNIFGLGDFMQSLYRAWEQTKQTVESTDLLSTTLINIWIALGHNGGKVATNTRKLLLLREFRDKLVSSKSHMSKYIETMTVDDKDAAQFDALEAYQDIIDVLEDEFGKPGWFNLLTWKRTPPTGPTYHQQTIMISIDDYKPAKTTIYNLLDNALKEDRLEPSKYLVFCYNSDNTEKVTDFDLEQPQVLSMKNYFSSTDNTDYKLIGLISHSGEDRSVGHYLAYRLIDGRWYYFNDKYVCEISVLQLGNQYSWTEDGYETVYLAFFEQF